MKTDWDRVWRLLSRSLVALMIIQGPILTGWLHDACTPAHLGLYWGVAIVSLSASMFTACVTFFAVCIDE